MTSERVKNAIKQICDDLVSLEQKEFSELLETYKETDITELLLHSGMFEVAINE
jgi:hypothetical protein